MKRVFGYSALPFTAVPDGLLTYFLSGFKIISLFSCRSQQFSLQLQVSFGCCSLKELTAFFPMITVFLLHLSF